MNDLILKTALTLILIAASVAYVIIKNYQRNLRRFRQGISSGDQVRLRIKTNFIIVVVIRRGSPGILLVKQFGGRLTGGRLMFVSVNNIYPH